MDIKSFDMTKQRQRKRVRRIEHKNDMKGNQNWILKSVCMERNMGERNRNDFAHDRMENVNNNLKV